MVALTKGRNTPERVGDMRGGLLAAGAVIFQGALVMRNAAGYLVAGSTATGLTGVGRAEEAKDNSAGANGDLTLLYRAGRFRYANSAAAEEITIADIGALCFVVDDQTVARTDGTATRSPAGIIEDVDAQGVWVCLDEALTATAAV